MTERLLLVCLALAMCLVCSKDTDARSSRVSRLALNQLAVGALWSKADNAWDNGDFDSYVAVMQQILALDATDLEAYTNGAWLLWSMGRDEEAVAMHTRATEELAGRYESWFEFGMYYRNHMKDNQKAKQMYLEAVRCQPHPNVVERQLAHTYEDLGEIEQALQMWQSLAQRFPEEAVMPFNLELLRKRHGL